ELLVDVDAEHFAARQANEVLRKNRLALVVGPQEHHADLDLHASAVRGLQRGRVLDLLLKAPLMPLGVGNRIDVFFRRLDVHSSSGKREERLENISLETIGNAVEIRNERRFRNGSVIEKRKRILRPHPVPIRMRHPFDIQLPAVIKRNRDVLADQLVKYNTIIDTLNPYILAE